MKFTKESESDILPQFPRTGQDNDWLSASDPISRSQSYPAEAEFET